MRDAIRAAGSSREPAPVSTPAAEPVAPRRRDPRLPWLVAFVVLAAVYVAMTIIIGTTGSFPGDGWFIDETSRFHGDHGLQHLANQVGDLAIAAVAFGLLVAACIAVAFRGATRLGGLVVIAAVLGTLGVKTLTLKIISRPDTGFHEFAFAFNAHGDEYPSGHATATLALAFAGLLLLSTRWQRTLAPVAAIAVIAIGVSRVLLGLHYASDVIAGWVLAGALVAGLHALALSLPASSPNRAE